MDHDWLFESITELENVSVKGFLLKKSTHGRYLDAFKLKSIRTSYFKKKVMSELERIKKDYEDEKLKIVNFDKHDSEENVVSILEVEKYSSIKNTIDQIFQSSEANAMDSLKSMQRAKFSAMLFDLPDEKSLITIDSVAIHNKAFEKGSLVATYDEIGLRELDKDSALIFKFGLPCIYFHKQKKLLVINREQTETIFNLLEHYQEKAIKKFNELVSDGIIELDKDIFQHEIKNITTARKINNMVEERVFTKDITIYKKHEELIIAHPEWDDEYTQLLIKENKVILNSNNRIKSFLIITKMFIMNPVIDPKQHYVVFQGRKIKTRSTP